MCRQTKDLDAGQVARGLASVAMGSRLPPTATSVRKWLAGVATDSPFSSRAIVWYCQPSGSANGRTLQLSDTSDGEDYPMALKYKIFVGSPTNWPGGMPQDQVWIEF